MADQRCCDLFCTVIDNFGDIGVCWRLARQLVAEHGYRVRLWVDDLPSFYRLCPTVDPDQALQVVAGVEVRHWPQTLPEIEPATLVIEAFGCRLPEAFLNAMVGKPCLWLNLEYLSAEGWVGECHGLASPHPRLALTQRFFFPGFAPGSGGLLRETDLLVRRDTFQNDRLAQAQFWAELGVPADTELRVSLFSYETPAIDHLMRHWQHGGQPTRLLVPEGRALHAVNGWLRLSLAPGSAQQCGSLTVHALPFTDQACYDQLLWACDINIVRGEDSLVRALWAGRPLLWHIYEQDDDAHLVKLQAMLDVYGAGLEPVHQQALQRMWFTFNDGVPAVDTAWSTWHSMLPRFNIHARQWCDEQAKQVDLASNVVKCHQLGVK